MKREKLNVASRISFIIAYFIKSSIVKYGVSKVRAFVLINKIFIALIDFSCSKVSVPIFDFLWEIDNKTSPLMLYRTTSSILFEVVQFFFITCVTCSFPLMNS